jgi:hypothetical protein
MRTLLLGSLILGLTLVALGCGQQETARPNDMPVKASQGMTKKGKATKTFEASLEDPPRK